MNNVLRTAGLWVAACAYAVSPSHAAVETVFEHSGCTDPTSPSEGWSANIDTSAGNSAGPLCADRPGIDAWATDDNATTLGSFANYSRTLTECQIQSARTHGWKITAIVRVAEIPDVPVGSVLLLYRDGESSYVLDLGSESDGDLSR